MKQSTLSATIFTIGAFFLWSTLGVFFRLTSLPTTVYTAYGSVVALIALYFAFFLGKKTSPFSNISVPLLLLGILAGVKGILWFSALRSMPIAIAMMVHNLAPLFAGVFSAVFLKEKPTASQYGAMVIGFIGFCLLLGISTSSFPLFSVGIVFSIIAAVLSGVQDVVQRTLSKTVSGSQQAFIFVLGQAVFSLAAFPQLSVKWKDMLSIGYFGILGTAIPIVLLSTAFTGLAAFEVATLGYVEPVMGALWGALFFGETITPQIALGGLLIFIAGTIAIRK